MASLAVTANALLSCRTLRRPTAAESSSHDDTISVLLPARNEAHSIVECLKSLLAQHGIDELLILDDDSVDATGDIARELTRGDPRVTVLPPSTAGVVPPNWLGKSWACHRLSQAAHGSVLVFVDADVTLSPDALSRTVATLRSNNLDMVCPYPRQLADTLLTRLVQPLLQWSWMSFVPLRISEVWQHPSMAVANGQLLAVDARAYRSVGGHAAVAHDVLEDVALARAFRRAGRRSAVVDGSEIATCRMYRTDRELIQGYQKSLWSAFGNNFGAASVMSLLGVLYLIPPIAIAIGPSPQTRALGTIGYLAGVSGRLLVASRVNQRTFPDALAQPASITTLAALTATSIRHRRAGTITWKGRNIR